MLKSVSTIVKSRGIEGRHLRFDTTPSWSPRIFAAGLRCIDALFALAASVVVAALFAPSMPSRMGPFAEMALATVLTCEVLWFIGGAKCADLGRSSGRERHILLAVLLGTTIVFGCLIIQPMKLAIIVALCAGWFLATVAMLFAGRLLSAELLLAAHMTGRLVNKVAVVGEEPVALALMRRLLKEDPALVRFIGCYRMTNDRHAGPRSLNRDGVPGPRGDIATLLLDCRLGGIDSIVVACPPADPEERYRLEAALADFAIDIYMLPDDVDMAGPDARPAVLGHQSLLMISERPLKDWKGVAKNAFDRVAALGILIAIAPALLTVAVLIRCDSRGPVLFRQLRVGFNNRTFNILKFRTMYVQSADRLATVQTTRDDPRVTPLGRILRKLSIDELPQLLNVLRGDMSLVGPRPHAPGTSAEGQLVETLVDGYGRRHLVKPGITGLAQVRGQRGRLSTRAQVEARVRCDLEYIRRQSVMLDVQIMLLTVLRELRSSRAF